MELGRITSRASSRWGGGPSGWVDAADKGLNTVANAVDDGLEAAGNWVDDKLDTLEEKVNQAALVRLGLMPPVPPALFPPAPAPQGASLAGGKAPPPPYDSENMYPSYYPTQKAQAALHSAKATSEMPKLEVREGVRAPAAPR